MIEAQSFVERRDPGVRGGQCHYRKSEVFDGVDEDVDDTADHDRSDASVLMLSSHGKPLELQCWELSVDGSGFDLGEFAPLQEPLVFERDPQRVESNGVATLFQPNRGYPGFERIMGFACVFCEPFIDLDIAARKRADPTRAGQRPEEKTVRARRTQDFAASFFWF